MTNLQGERFRHLVSVRAGGQSQSRRDERARARMSEQGFSVKTARTAEQALRVLTEGETNLVVSRSTWAPATVLPCSPERRRQPWGKDVAWVIYTRRQERAAAQRAFELGVVDYVTSPRRPTCWSPSSRPSSSNARAPPRAGASAGRCVRWASRTWFRCSFTVERAAT